MRSATSAGIGPGSGASASSSRTRASRCGVDVRLGALVLDLVTELGGGRRGRVTRSGDVEGSVVLRGVRGLVHRCGPSGRACSGRTGRQGCAGRRGFDGPLWPSGSPGFNHCSVGSPRGPGRGTCPVSPARPVAPRASGRGARARAARPRAQRDLMVPSATPRMTAASATGTACMSTRTSAARWPSGSLARASWMSRRTSVEAWWSCRSASSYSEQLGRRPAPAQPVEAGVDDDAVQPRRDGRLAPEGVGAAEGGDEAVLDAVGGELGIADGAQRDGPHPVLVPAEELGEGMVVTVDVQCQQLPVAQVGDRSGIPRAHGQRTVTSLICAR